MQNVSIMMVVTHVNVMRDTDQRPKKHLKYGWHTGEITRAVLISMNAKIAHSMIAILKLRSVFEFFRGPDGSGEVPACLGNVFGTGGSIYEKVDQSIFYVKPIVSL